MKFSIDSERLGVFLLRIDLAGLEHDLDRRRDEITDIIHDIFLYGAQASFRLIAGLPSFWLIGPKNRA